MAMNPLGLLLAGVLGDSFGTREGLWIGGGVIVVLSLLALALPSVRSLNTRDEQRAVAAPAPATAGNAPLPTSAQE
jgi:MFS family permease